MNLSDSQNKLINPQQHITGSQIYEARRRIRSHGPRGANDLDLSHKSPTHSLSQMLLYLLKITTFRNREGLQASVTPILKNEVFQGWSWRTISRLFLWTKSSSPIYIPFICSKLSLSIAKRMTLQDTTINLIIMPLLIMLIQRLISITKIIFAIINIMPGFQTPQLVSLIFPSHLTQSPNFSSLYRNLSSLNICYVYVTLLL